MQRYQVIPNNPEREGFISYLPDIPYRGADGGELKMQILMPEKKGSYPLIVFIQGSAWTTPNTQWQIPQLSRFAREGMVVASVTHRSCFDAPAPAFLKDVKAAIRFLRANAETYQIDKDRVCAWGTSSGGNTALLIGFTGKMPEFEEGENLSESSEVRCVVDCFGPTDIPELIKAFPDETPESEGGKLMAALAGGEVYSHMENLRRISPIAYVDDRETPPILILHGDADELVPYTLSEVFYQKLLEHKKDAYLVRVTNAPHEGDFWSDPLLDIVSEYLREKL